MKLLLLLFLSAPCTLAQSVEGSVFDAATGDGITGVKVELLKGGTPFYETLTDGAGRFRFDNVREADYAARYQSPDYWLTAGPSDYRQFHVGPGDPVKLETRLMPWSRIAGRVVDGRGRGVPDVEVHVTGPGMVANGRTYLRTSWGGGGGGALSDSLPAMTHRGKTDAEGRFEVGLMPGAYTLSAIPAPGMKPPEPEKNGPVLAWSRTYYPNAVVPDAAGKIVVLPGGEVSGIEMKLQAVPVRAVRGIVLDPDGAPAANVPVALGEVFLTLGEGSGTTRSKADGTFELSAVPQGEWSFSAETKIAGVKLHAVEWIEVARHDIENLKLHLMTPLTVRGKVLAIAPKDAPPLRAGPFILARRGSRTRQEGDMDFILGGVANPDANGDFIVQDIYPGVYRPGPLFQPPPAPYYMESIDVGGANLLMQDVEISSATTITVVYKTDSGTVSGKAENCASGGVLLVPRDPALRGRGFSRSGPCDSNSQYEVRGVRPGEYYALAFAGNGPILPPDDALLSQAVKVTVRPGEATSADVRAVTRPIY